MQDDRDSEMAIRRQIAEQQSKNEKRLNELAKKRNIYPVFYVST
jgi:hypothetical protein